MKHFSIKEAITYGWETFKKNPWVLLGVSMTVTILPTVLQYALEAPFRDASKGGSANPLMWIGTIVSSLVSIYLSIGILKFYLRLIDGKKVQYQDMFNVQADEYFHYLLASIVYGLIVLVGIILLIVPGIYFGVKYQYYSYLIVDKRLSVMDAIKESGRITQGNIRRLFLLSFTLMLVSLLGVLALVIGIFVASPVVGLAQAFVYRKLVAKKE